jgi:hypothetical protein
VDADSSLEIRAGQRWRLGNGTEVTVQQVEGETIHCAVHLQSMGGKTQSPGGAISGVIAADSYPAETFTNSILLRPIFRASFGAKVRGSGVADRVMQALHDVASVESRGTPRVDTGTGVLHGDQAEYVVEVAAPDAEHAKAIIAGALGDDLVTDVRVAEL